MVIVKNLVEWIEECIDDLCFYCWLLRVSICCYTVGSSPSVCVICNPEKYVVVRVWDVP
jgi:hypothetical protein